MAEPVPPTPSGVDPSMEDILASIRRILSEDGAAAEGAAREASAAPEDAPDGGGRNPEPDVLALDPSMLVPEPVPPPETPPEPPRHEPPPETPAAIAALPPETVLPEPDPASEPPPELQTPSRDLRSEGLVAPAAAAAASSSVGSLLKTLGSHRQSLSVSRAGPTLEDMVREELRPVLKAWLDEHLPGLVERLVRAEIERVVGRAADL